jgi:hypothetical protein
VKNSVITPLKGAQQVRPAEANGHANGKPTHRASTPNRRHAPDKGQHALIAADIIQRGNAVPTFAGLVLTNKAVADVWQNASIEARQTLLSAEFAKTYPAENLIFRIVAEHFFLHTDTPDESTIRAMVTARADAGDAQAAAAFAELANLTGYLPTQINDSNAAPVAVALLEAIGTATITTQPAPRFKILSTQAVKEERAPQALLDGVLYVNNTAELCGGHASFKSFVALATAEAVAGGYDFHGRATLKTPVVYITGEGRGGASQRIRALEIRHQRPCEVQFILEAVQLHRPDEVTALLSAIAQLAQAPGLIVVDTLARCFVGGDENSARDAGLFVAGVDRIRAATGAAVLVLHHLSKAGDSRGSTAFSGAFDTIIEAKRENTTVTLRCLKQKDAAEFEPMTFVRRIVELDENDEHGRPISSLIFDSTDASLFVPKADETRQQVLQVLQDALASNPAGLRASDWQEKVKKQVGIGSSRFYIFRDELTVENGPVEKVGSLYRLHTPFTPLTPLHSTSAKVE